MYSPLNSYVYIQWILDFKYILLYYYYSSSPFIVNELIVLFCNQLGLGHTAMKMFGSLFGWEGLHLKTFQDKESRIISSIIDNTEEVLIASVTKVKESYRQMDPTLLDPMPITVSFDGSWHKRGHTSMYGVAAVIEVLTGLVVDYVVLSKYCHACSLKKKDFCEESVVFHEWYEDHKDNCAINYQGSSNAMEVEAAVRLWQRSEERHGLLYTGFLSDGDSKAHKAVSDLNIYTEPIVKEECINHVHKRMGTALINLSKQKRLGGRGHGRLTKEKAIKFQHYFRHAITHNIGNQDGMRTAIWASLFHCMSTDEDPQHDRCPSGDNSWCFYNKAEATGDNIPLHSAKIRYPLSPEVATEMIPIYERMSDSNLLKRMEKGKTQNTNECLHSVIWSRCPKHVFVGKHKLEGAVASAISSFNEGSIHLTQVMQKLAIESNEVMNIHLKQLDNRRLTSASTASSVAARKERSQRWISKRQERVRLEAGEGTSYAAGAF